METKGFFQFQIIIIVVVSSLFASFEYFCYGSMSIINILPFQGGDRLWTPESDVYRRQILTSKVGHRTERVNKLI